MSQLVVLLPAWATIQASGTLVRRFRIECFHGNASRAPADNPAHRAERPPPPSRPRRTFNSHQSAAVDTGSSSQVGSVPGFLVRTLGQFISDKTTSRPSLIDE